jgi:hypothetical protein
MSAQDVRTYPIERLHEFTTRVFRASFPWVAPFQTKDRWFSVQASRILQHFELVFKDLDVHAPRLSLN